MLLQPQCRGFVRPYTHALAEPAHTLYVHGVGNTTLYLYFETVFQEGVAGIHVRLHEFLDTWTWPHGVGKDQLVELFSPARVRSRRTAQHFKADASKFMQVFPVLGYWVAAYGIAGMFARGAANAFLAFRICTTTRFFDDWVSAHPISWTSWCVAFFICARRLGGMPVCTPSSTGWCICRGAY